MLKYPLIRYIQITTKLKLMQKKEKKKEELYYISQKSRYISDKKYLNIVITITNF